MSLVVANGSVVEAGIVLKKSFWGDERNFSGPLVRFADADLRDHIVSQKRPPTFVSALKGVAALDATTNGFLMSFDFRLSQQYRRFSDMAGCLT
jgi:hypothetical protein